MSHKVDPRVQRTVEAIHEAMLSLIVEVGFDKITVQNLADRAGINRATFYRHYTDKFDLADQLTQRLFKRSPLDASELPGRMVWIFEHVAEHADFYLAAVSSNGIPGFVEHVRDQVEVGIREQLAYLGIDTTNAQIPADLSIRYLAAAQSGFVEWWLRNGMPFSAETAALYLTQLHLNGGMHALAWTP